MSDDVETALTAALDENNTKAWRQYTLTLAELTEASLRERRRWLYLVVRRRHFGESNDANDAIARPISMRFEVEHRMLNIISAEIGRRERADALEER